MSGYIIRKEKVAKLKEQKAELLAALKAILEYPYPEYDNATLGKARAAIAKAEEPEE